jgi:hypothetical protein
VAQIQHSHPFHGSFGLPNRQLAPFLERIFISRRQLAPFLERISIQTIRQNCQSLIQVEILGVNVWNGDSFQNRGELPTLDLHSDIFLQKFNMMSWLTVEYEFMLPKRRFWKAEQKMTSGFSKPFSMAWVLDLGYEPLKNQSKIRMSSFVPPSKIFVWGA